MAFKPRAWRNARQRNSSYQDAEMAAAGRAPNGRRGYKTRPGAPLSKENYGTNGTPGVSGGFTNDGTWDSFFHERDYAIRPVTPATPSSESGAGRFSGLRSKYPEVTPETSSTAAELSGFYEAPVEANPNDPSSYAKAAQQGATNYFDSVGQPISKPGPGVLRPLPYIPVDPASNALDNPDFVGNPYGEVGSDEDGLFTEF